MHVHWTKTARHQTHSFSLTHTHSFSLTHTHTRIAVTNDMLTRPRPRHPTKTLSLSLSVIPSLSLSKILSLFLSLSLSLSHTHTHEQASRMAHSLDLDQDSPPPNANLNTEPRLYGLESVRSASAALLQGRAVSFFFKSVFACLCMWDMIYLYGGQASFVCWTWVIRVWTWLIYMWDKTLSYVGHDSVNVCIELKVASRGLYMWDMTQW